MRWSLIARANEAEGFIQETTSPKWFECLCRRAAASNESEAKWQFAYLPECSCSQEVRDMILDFAKDPNEYVSRRALLAMPALRPDCGTVRSAILGRNCYSLNFRNTSGSPFWVSLDAIHSDLLPQYLEQAKQDGRRYLLERKRIEGELTMNETLTSPAYHGFLPPIAKKSRSTSLPTYIPRVAKKIHRLSCPFVRTMGMTHNGRTGTACSILTIGWPDCEQLLIPHAETNLSG